MKLNSDGKLGKVADQSVVKRSAERKGASLSNESHCIIKKLNIGKSASSLIRPVSVKKYIQVIQLKSMFSL